MTKLLRLSLFLFLTLLFSCEDNQVPLDQIWTEAQATGSEPLVGMVENAQNFDVIGVQDSLDQLTQGPTASAPCNNISNDPTGNKDSKSNYPHLNITKDHEGTNKKLWATNYYTPIYDDVEGGIVLKRKSEATLYHNGSPVSLPEKKWCYAAMEGSVSIKFPDGSQKTYNYEGVGSMQASCAKYFAGRFASTGKVKFKEADSKWGHGVKNYSLVPYRTIAVDPKRIPYGSVVFIPEAKGKVVTLENGESFVHDGYFFAGDTGGAIKKNHIDVFTGNSKNHPFDFIKSRSSGTFDAKIITKNEANKDLIRKLTDMHLKKY